MDYNDVQTGYRVAAQLPLDFKAYKKNEASLIDLGINNNLAFTYYEGMIVYCVEERQRYEWREVLLEEDLEGLLENDFVYPAGTVALDIDYSNRAFNFFAKSESLEINSIGTGINVYKGFNADLSAHEIYSLIAQGAQLSYDAFANILISIQGINVGLITGAGIYKGYSQNKHEFKKIAAHPSSNSMIVSSDADNVFLRINPEWIQDQIGIWMTNNNQAFCDLVGQCAIPPEDPEAPTCVMPVLTNDTLLVNKTVGFETVFVLNNDQYTLPIVLTIQTLPQNGAVVINPDKSLTYTHDGSEELADSFVYNVNSNGCIASATVTVEIMEDDLEELPTYNAVLVYRNETSGLACAVSGNNDSTKYINTLNFATSSKLYDNVNGTVDSEPGWYHNGNVARYWNGNMFTDFLNCG